MVPSQADRTAIKEQLVPVMISLSTPQLSRLQAQVSRNNLLNVSVEL
jgi:hypothetical protein